MNSIKKIKCFSSVAGIFLIALATTTNSVMAQSLTTNASNAIGNVSAPQPANQTAERGENVSIARTNTSTALNKTAEVAKGIGSGAADVLGNISGEIQQGISGNK